MADLPQHAGQVALWRDLLLDKSKWQSLVHTNYFTPYLFGYGLALLLSFVMSVSAALKLLLTLSYFGFIVACVALRRRFGGDGRLDWLFIASFFSYPYALGLYTFLLAGPLGVLFILLTHRYAGRPTPRFAIILLCADVALFFAHGLVFLFANAIGVIFLVMKCRPLPRLSLAMLPYIAVGLLCVAYALLTLVKADASPGGQPGIFWGWNLTRVAFLLFAAGWSTATPGFFFLLTSFMLMAPLALGCRLNRNDPTVFVPLIVTVVIWAAVPHRAAGTDVLYLRFAMFLLPSYALIFRAPERPPRPSMASRLWLPLACWVFLAVHAERLVKFATESAGFENVLAAAEPGARALAVMFDSSSVGSGNLHAYLGYPTWYQAEKEGFVDFNFATYLPQIVRYRSDRVPNVFGRAVWAERPQMGFDWDRDHASVYRYFFVRSETPLPPNYFPDGRCKPQLVKPDGEWSLFENVNCLTPF
jgi:hypothetical protein